MSSFFLHLVDRLHPTDEPEGIELPDLNAAIALAIKSALDIMAHDIREGRLNLNSHIEIRDEAGNILHTVRFRELIDTAELLPN